MTAASARWTPDELRARAEQGNRQREQSPPPNTEEPWPHPADISSPADCEPYPLEFFPGAAQIAIREYAEFGRQPLPLIGSSALGQIAMAAQGLANVAINDLLVSPLSLYLMLVAMSGERKSAADKLFSRPLKGWIDRAREDHLSAHRAAVAMAASHKRRIAGVSRRFPAWKARTTRRRARSLSACKRR